MTRIICLCATVWLAALPEVSWAQTAATEDPAEPPPAEAQDAAPVPAPEHAHTGWATLLKDTARDFAAFPKRRSTWVILGLGAGAALATHPEDTYVEHHIVGNHGADRIFSLGRWVGTAYVQGGTAVGLWAIGRYVVAPATDESQTNKYSELGFDLIRAQLVSQAVVHGMKYTIRRDRPTGECCAFPSGHAAAAFAAALVLERHLGYRASLPALVGATYVATSRLVDNRHFLSDVMFGAAIGTASAWTVVGRPGPNQFTLQPVPVPGGMMLAFTRVGD